MPRLTDHLARFSFELAYRTGRARWDSGVVPPEVVRLVEGPAAPGAASLPPDSTLPAGPCPRGLAYDLGCGTGTTTVYLAAAGLRAVGIDVVGRSLAIAQQRAASLPAEARARLEFRRADLAALDGYAPAWRRANGAAVLAVDVGCFHALATDEARDRYARGLAVLLGPGTTYLMYGFDAQSPRSPFGRLAARMGGRLGLRGGEVAERFGRAGLRLEAEARGVDVSGPASAWYVLSRIGEPSGVA